MQTCGVDHNLAHVDVDAFCGVAPSMIACISAATAGTQAVAVQDLRDLVRKLLVLSPARRLGATRNGATGVKEHAWFRDFDWESFARKSMKAPYVPVVRMLTAHARRLQITRRDAP